MHGGYYTLGDEGILLEITENRCNAWCHTCGAPMALCVCIGEVANPYDR
jgi:hypothetical protein